jgi:hypothetical protein
VKAPLMRIIFKTGHYIFAEWLHSLFLFFSLNDENYVADHTFILGFVLIHFLTKTEAVLVLTELNLMSAKYFKFKTQTHIRYTKIMAHS